MPNVTGMESTTIETAATGPQYFGYGRRRVVSAKQILPALEKQAGIRTILRHWATEWTGAGT